MLLKLIQEAVQYLKKINILTKWFEEVLLPPSPHTKLNGLKGWFLLNLKMLIKHHAEREKTLIASISLT